MTRHPSSHPSREVRRRAAAPALTLAMALTLAACGGDDDASRSSPSALSADDGDDAPSTAEVEPTTAEPTGSDEDSDNSAADSEGAGDDDEESQGSADEDGGGEDGDPDTWATFTEEPPPVAMDPGGLADDPRVQAVTRFNEQLARAATADDPERPEWLATLNEDSLPTLRENFAEEFGRTYPGPLPYEVLDVQDLEDGTASVQGCLVTDGFSVGPVGEGEGMTGMVVSSIEYSLVEDPAQEGAWLVDAIYAGAYDCSSTSVEARTW
ncbi:hypothetical protein [Serinicoccus sp. LYQ131]|uniref:hypothetical protein n=1 Tax=Serinicoccus sp. LYQ131 TaxID=3378797 RepID=UPI003853DD48